MVLIIAIKNIAEKSGISRNKKVTGHSFRTTYATMSYNAGMRIEEIHKRLNHKNIHQTSAYIKWVLQKDKTAWIPDLGEDLEQFRVGEI